jgi:hypothetical protein
MALIFCDSFDHYATSTQKWIAGPDAPIAISSAGARHGIQGLRTSNYNQSLIQTFSARATWIVGFAYRVNSTAATYKIVTLNDSASVQAGCWINASTGQINVVRNGTVLGTSTTVLVPSTWYYIEFKGTIDNATGVAVLKINDTTEVSLSGIDTQNTANANANQIEIGGSYGGSSSGYLLDFDDVYICDNSGGAPNNDFLGDVRVDALMPSGNGNSSNLVGSDADSTDNYLLVDEIPPNDDTDYVESATVTDEDTYVYGNLDSTSGTVYGVQIVPRARKTDAGARAIASVARLSATEVDSADKVLSSSYTYQPDVRETKPGGGAWTIADVNSAEFGVKVTA